MDVPSYTPEDAPVPEGEVVVERASTPQELGPRLNRTAADVVRFLMQQGEMVTATQSLTDDMIELFAAEIGAEIRLVDPGEEQEVELQKVLGVEELEEADTDETYVDRYRPLVTDRFLDEYEAEGIPVPPQNLTAFRESGRLRTAEVDSVEVPEPAQEGDHQIVLTVEGNLTDADGGEEIGPRESSRTMLLNNTGEDDPDWRVDRFVQQ